MLSVATERAVYGPLARFAPEGSPVDLDHEAVPMVLSNCSELTQDDDPSQYLLSETRFRLTCTTATPDPVSLAVPEIDASALTAAALAGAVTAEAGAVMS